MPELEPAIVKAVETKSRAQEVELYRKLFSIACEVIQQDSDLYEDMAQRLFEEYGLEI